MMFPNFKEVSKPVLSYCSQWKQSLQSVLILHPQVSAATQSTLTKLVLKKRTAQHGPDNITFKKDSKILSLVHTILFGFFFTTLI